LETAGGKAGKKEANLSFKLLGTHHDQPEQSAGVLPSTCVKEHTRPKKKSLGKKKGTDRKKMRTQEALPIIKGGVKKLGTITEKEPRSGKGR